MAMALTKHAVGNSYQDHAPPGHAHENQAFQLELEPDLKQQLKGLSFFKF